MLGLRFFPALPGESRSVHKDWTPPYGREWATPYPTVAPQEPAGEDEVRNVPAVLGPRLKTKKDLLNSIEELPADLR